MGALETMEICDRVSSDRDESTEVSETLGNISDNLATEGCKVSVCRGGDQGRMYQGPRNGAVPASQPDPLQTPS